MSRRTSHARELYHALNPVSRRRKDGKAESGRVFVGRVVMVTDPESGKEGPSGQIEVVQGGFESVADARAFVKNPANDLADGVYAPFAKIGDDMNVKTETKPVRTVE